MSDKSFDYQAESQGDKFARKARDSPFMIIGLVGLIGAVGMGAYKYRTKGEMSTSIYLMQLRVIAQGTVVGCLTGGILYSMVSNLLKMKNRPAE